MLYNNLVNVKDIQNIGTVWRIYQLWCVGYQNNKHIIIYKQNIKFTVWLLWVRNEARVQA